MNLANRYPIIAYVTIIFLCYIVHKTIFFLLASQLQCANFLFSLELLYLLYATFSVLIFIILTVIKQKSFDNIGMIFMLITTIKTIICGLFLKTFYSNLTNFDSIEKTNFFVMFILFLAIETLFTRRILNNNQ